MERLRTLYVRNVPDRVLREARALAARNGITLGALVIAALEEKTHGAAPGSSALADDMAWFAEHRGELEDAFLGRYVAIAGGRVIDHDADFDALATRVFEANGGRSVFMPRVQRGERVLKLRSPRVA